ncbi:hypothetical protein LX87_03900 [Larkinella arboricola]|uniref:Uncharacterized protein n=1 Tax=Larkinella arboricola TaxID=643671 RepID=A0A327WPU8_LARAB|nr:hypothetical protein [Larkinella arboricola]RAJ94016.1 hypothetical protein LX87_03900 [Larkinella arboricola]
MNGLEPQEEEMGAPFRMLFSEEETQGFYRPVVELPTHRIAYWSIGASVLLALTLIFSVRSQPKQPKPVLRSGKTLLLPPASQKTTGTLHAHQPGR